MDFLYRAERRTRVLEVEVRHFRDTSWVIEVAISVGYADFDRVLTMICQRSQISETSLVQIPLHQVEAPTDATPMPMLRGCRDPQAAVGLATKGSLRCPTAPLRIYPKPSASLIMDTVKVALGKYARALLFEGLDGMEEVVVDKRKMRLARRSGEVEKSQN